MKIINISIVIIILFIAWISWNSYQRQANEVNANLLSCPNCNVILISLDTLRAKSLPCFGYEKNTAPFLCDLAAKSFTFTNTYSQSTYTLDSHVSLFTSLYPTSHGVATPYVHTLSKDVKTLAEVMKQQGYQTYYLGTGIYDDPQLPLKQGLGRGFDTIISAEDPLSWTEAMSKIDVSSGKFFTFLHTFSVHHPYVPRPESVQKINGTRIPTYDSWYETCKGSYDRIRAVHPDIFPNRSRGKGYNYCDEIAQFYLREGVNGKPGELLEKEPHYQEFLQGYASVIPPGMQASQAGEIYQELYEAKITELDEALQGFFSFLEEQDLLDRTIIIVFGDHGEEFYQHGQLTHGRQLYEETIHVPLIISVPGTKPRRIDKLAQLIDVVPTILPMLSIPVPDQAQGINLLSGRYNDFIFSEVSIDRKRAIISRHLKLDKNWKLIINFDNPDGVKTRELYHLTDDPNERKNLADINTVEADSLELNLTDYVAQRKIYSPTTQDFPADINEEDRQKLLQTGYR